MAFVGKHKSIKHIKLLATQQAERTNWNDAGFIAFAGLMYFNLVEMSLLNVEDLISEKGKIHSQFVMPEHISGENGRVVLIGKSGFIVDVIRNIIDYRLSNGFDVINNANIFAKLNPKSRFFLDKNGNEFKYKITNSNYQPYGLRRHTNNLNFGEGINIKGLRESFIGNTWNASREKNLADVQIIKDLSVLTGLSTNAIRLKIIRRDKNVLEVVKNLYQNI